jgi:hypothetical protein
MIANIEIVVAFLPEVLRSADEPARDPLFQRLDGVGERLPPRLADQ